jgi:hypothetical protein
MQKSLVSLAIALAFGFAGSAFAADNATGMSKDQYKAEKDKIEAQYKADKKSCDGMKGNAKDVCHADAKGKEKVAKADLEEQYKPSPRHEQEAKDAKAKADYEVAKEKCEDLKGKSAHDCKTQAKDQYKVAKQDAKAQKQQEKANMANNNAASANGNATSTAK